MTLTRRLQVLFFWFDPRKSTDRGSGWLWRNFEAASYPLGGACFSCATFKRFFGLLCCFSSLVRWFPIFRFCFLKIATWGSHRWVSFGCYTPSAREGARAAHVGDSGVRLRDILRLRLLLFIFVLLFIVLWNPFGVSVVFVFFYLFPDQASVGLNPFSCVCNFLGSDLTWVWSSVCLWFFSLIDPLCEGLKSYLCVQFSTSVVPLQEGLPNYH